MKIWLDDQIDTVRKPPKGWIGVKSAIKACKLIKEGNVEEISFDHDLGTIFTGHTVAKFIEKLAYFNKIKEIKWDIHSANPVGRKNIESTMISAKRFWDM